MVVDGGDTATELATSGERSWSSLDAAERCVARNLSNAVSNGCPAKGKQKRGQ